MIDKIIYILNNEYGFQLKDFEETTSFLELQKINNSFDSLTRIQFLIDLEDVLGICLPANAKIDNVLDIKKYIGD